MKNRLVLLLGLLCAATVSGCADLTHEPSGPAPQKYRVLSIYSDPPGAHVYAGNKYWGETQEKTPIRIIWNGAMSSMLCTLTLKKRGYQTTTENVQLDLKYGSIEEASSANDDQKTVVVLDLEE